MGELQWGVFLCFKLTNHSPQLIHNHKLVCVCLTGKWWSWYPCPAQFSSGCVPLSQSAGQQSCCEPWSSEGPHQHCKWNPLLFSCLLLQRTHQLQDQFYCIRLLPCWITTITYVLVSLASWCIMSRIMRQAAEQPSGVEWMLMGFSAAPAFSLRWTSILQQQKEIHTWNFVSPFWHRE